VFPAVFLLYFSIFSPFHATIWRFRQLLNTENLLEPLLEQINHHLEQNSIIISLGLINIIDATLNLVLSGLRLGLKNRQVGEKWVDNDYSYLYKGLA
jgi:hypothetical protein